MDAAYMAIAAAILAPVCLAIVAMSVMLLTRGQVICAEMPRLVSVLWSCRCDRRLMDDGLNAVLFDIMTTYDKDYLEDA